MMTSVQKIFWQMNFKIMLRFKSSTWKTNNFSWGNSNSINPNFKFAIFPFQEKYVTNTFFHDHILLKDKSNTGQTKQYVLAQNQDKPKTRPVLAPEFQT